MLGTKLGCVVRAIHANHANHGGHRTATGRRSRRAATCGCLRPLTRGPAGPNRPSAPVVHGFPHRVSRVVYVAYVDNVEYGRIIGKALPAGPGSDRTPRWGPKSDLLTVDDSSIDVEKIGSEPVERPRKRGVS